MHKTHYIDLNETIVYHRLENGLSLAIIEKKGFKTSSFFLATPYGALDVYQEDDQKQYSNSLGIAHFLEHKLFENNNGIDVMEAFSELGAYVNAFTSHNETVYTFSGVKNIEKGLNLLLDFVQQFDVTEASVEKEKGIIVQELNMYNQMPEQRLINETYQALYNNHPIRFDIGGDEASVNSISREELIEVYQRNYHPQNSLLVCVSHLKAQDLIKMIENNQIHKTFMNKRLVKRSLTNENTEVNKAYSEFEMDINASKMTYSFKLAHLSSDESVNLKREWTLRMACELVFSSINENYQTWLDKNRIHDYFGYEIEVNKAYGFVMFYGEGEDKDDFKALIDEALKTDLNQFEEDFIPLKRRYNAMLIRSLNDHDDYAVSLIRSTFANIPFEYQFDVLDQIRFEDLKQTFETILKNPSSFVFMKKK